MLTQQNLIELLIKYVAKNYMRIFYLSLEHLYISFIALSLTLSICIPVAIYMTRNEKITPYAIGVANIFQTIPSLALLGFLIFFFGIGNDNAICALFLYAMLPVLQNTYTGIKNVPEHLVQAARGMGMTELQILLKVELPLARHVIIAGVRVATVWTIATAALASCIGGGGLGKLIFSGLSTIRYEIILAGAIPVTLITLAADQGLSQLQKFYSPENRSKRMIKKLERMDHNEKQTQTTKEAVV